MVSKSWHRPAWCTTGKTGLLVQGRGTLHLQSLHRIQHDFSIQTAHFKNSFKNIRTNAGQTGAATSHGSKEWHTCQRTEAKAGKDTAGLKIYSSSAFVMFLITELERRLTNRGWRWRENRKTRQEMTGERSRGRSRGWWVKCSQSKLHFFVAQEAECWRRRPQVILPTFATRVLFSKHSHSP